MRPDTANRSGRPTAKPSPAEPAEPRRVADLESRWPSVNLEEQRRLYARIEALREKLLGARRP